MVFDVRAFRTFVWYMAMLAVFMLLVVAVLGSAAALLISC